MSENEYYDDEIDLVALLAYALKHVLFVAVFAIVGLAIALLVNVNRIKKPDFQNEVAQAKYEIQIAQANVNNLEQERNILEQTISNSPLMALNPSSVSEAKYYFYVSPENAETLSSIVNGYTSYFKTLDYSKLLNSSLSNNQLSEVVKLETEKDESSENSSNTSSSSSSNTNTKNNNNSKTEITSNTLILTVWGSSEAEVSNYGKILSKAVFDSKSTVEKAAYNHELTLQNQAISTGYNQNVLEQQAKLQDKLTKNNTQLTKANDTLKGLSEVGTSFVKYSVIGVFAGCFIAACVILVQFIGTSPLTGSSRMGGIYFGAYNSKKASKLTGEKKWTKDSEADYLEASIQEYTKEGSTVAVVSSITILPELEATLKKLNRKPLIISKADTNPVLLKEIKNADTIIFFEKPLVSKTKTIRELKTMLDQQNKKADGFVLIFG